MLAISSHNVWAHKRRLAGTFLAVVLGVAFLAGTLMLGDTLRTNFERLFNEAGGATDVVVRSTTTINDKPGSSNRATIDASLLTTVQGVDGVARAVPSIDGYGQLLDHGGTGIGGKGPPTRADNWITEPSLNPYHLVEGRAPAADGKPYLRS